MIRRRIKLAALCFGALAPCISLTAAWGESTRGQYLVEALAACDNCHTPRGANGYDLAARFSGGSQTFLAKTYAVRGGNISTDKETGIGGWTDDALRAAIVEGLGPDGRLAPAMPSDSYRAFTKRDLNAVIGYLRSNATPVRSAAAPGQRHDAGWAPHPLPGAEGAFDEAALDDKIKLGLYVASVARCMACHSGETDDAPDHANKLGAGGKVFRTPAGVAIASNISSHLSKGVGAWADDELKRAITPGVSRDGAPVKPPMSTLSKAHFLKMSPRDLDALVAWLRTVPPQE
ncbi:c-type cytochrome [Methylocystis echinoides]|uniref:Cytochrome c n=1 Tax=Methylocystis echinoides TaxID=29468 RepID=A0A9W6GZ84_9HYPH|nr:c-type cytochrome [Methylocystis echinoides]GLI95614.1 cytochrome c [Methylocystis echinoides]